MSLLKMSLKLIKTQAKCKAKEEMNSSQNPVAQAGKLGWTFWSGS